MSDLMTEVIEMMDTSDILEDIESALGELTSLPSVYDEVGVIEHALFMLRALRDRKAAEAGMVHYRVEVPPMLEAIHIQDLWDDATDQNPMEEDPPLWTVELAPDGVEMWVPSVDAERAKDMIRRHMGYEARIEEVSP